ncbi:hypothetical protein PQX77_003348 [Marasmius sp. AFHP31]|nr:hypothetical protein PQX77_003348 [Marasmius sp. AFHP31]
MPSNKQEDNKGVDAVLEKDEVRAKKDAWEEVMKRVNKNDNGMEEGWKEDIDTLLVFAGLFSAVVTAFTIESYQWLSEDPSDQSIAILTHISAQLNNRNVSSFEPPQFTPDPSLVRINTFWFLSLILALVDALFGLMCKQWLREYRRPTNTQTPAQWLTLRCFKGESFERWHVPSFLAALPIILEGALFCFFAGLLELLWTKHSVPFAVSVTVIGTAVAFYITTTLLPGIGIIRLAFRIHPEIHLSRPWPWQTLMNQIPDMEYLCPYKSPQAWAAFKLLAWVMSSSSPFSRPIVSHYLGKRFYKDRSNVPEASVRSVSGRLRRLENWSSVDLDIIQRFSQIDRCPDMYEMKAHRWLVQQFRDSPLMVPHLQTLLRALPPEVVMPTVFGRDIVRVDRDWTVADMELALEGGNSEQTIDTPTTFSRMRVQLLYFHRIWLLYGSPLIRDFHPQPLSWEKHHPLSWTECCAPLTRILQLMLPDRDPEGERLALRYIENLRGHYADIDVDLFEFESATPMISSLAKGDLRHLVDQRPLLDLLVWIHNVQDYHRLDNPYALIDDLDTIRIGHGLPKNFFARKRSFFPVSMARLNTLLGDSSTKEVALELMGDFQRAYQDDISGFDAPVHLLDHLVSYLFRNIPAGIERYPLHLREEFGRFETSAESSSDEIPYLFTSRGGLSFLRSLNVTIHDQPDQVNAYLSSTIERWVLGLKCVAHLNRLPLDYFVTIRDSERPPGTLEAGAGGDTSPSSPPSVVTGGRGEDPFTPTSLSTLAEEGTSVGMVDSGEAEWNVDILERHLFDYLIATEGLGTVHDTD